MPVTASRTSTASSRPLAALRATALEHLFQSWRGRSGRRYIFSVHPVAGVAAFDCGRAVVVAVRRTSGAPEIAFVFQPTREGRAFAAWAEQARLCGAPSFMSICWPKRAWRATPWRTTCGRRRLLAV